MFWPNGWFKDAYLKAFYRLLKMGRGPYGVLDHHTGKMRWYKKPNHIWEEK